MPAQMAIEEMVYEMRLTLPDGMEWNPNVMDEHPADIEDRRVDELLFDEDGNPLEGLVLNTDTHYIDDNGEVKKKIDYRTLSQHDPKQGITTGSPDPDALDDTANMLLAQQQGLDFDDEDVQELFPRLDEQL